MSYSKELILYVILSKGQLGLSQNLLWELF